MLSLLTVIHVLACLLVISLVLLQDPKSAGGGGIFGGGGTNSLLGATGAVTFLTRLTRYSAIMFFVTSFVLSLPREGNRSVIDTVPAGAAVPAAPAQPLDSNPAMQDPKQAGTEAAPAQGSNPVSAEAIRKTAEPTPAKK